MLTSRGLAPVQSPGQQGAAVAGQLTKLADLRGRALLTDSEFQPEKRNLLDG